MSDYIQKKQLISNNIFFMIPSWGNVIGWPTLGKYLGQDISSVLSDPILFFGGMEASITTSTRTLYFLFGLGYYYTKFELKGQSYAMDHRELTTIVLPDFVYDSITTAKPITLENDQDVVINERVLKTPIDLSFRQNTQRAFIQGALTRNIFIPYKDIILEMFQNVQNRDSYNFDTTGHQILSALPESYDRILVSDKIKSKLDSNYLKSIPGLYEIIPGAEEFLNTYFTVEELDKISKSIKSLKEIYSNLTYDNMHLFSILENAAVIIGPNSSPRINQEQFLKNKLTSKSLVFYTALERQDSIIPWPESIHRQSKVELEISLMKPKTRLYSPQETAPLKKMEFGKNPSADDEKFEIRTQTFRTVESKVLPDVPKGNIEEILLYLKYIINEDYEMRAIGEAFNRAKENIRKITLHTSYMFEMQKIANIYQKKEPNQGLTLKDKQNLLEKIDLWLLDSKK